MGVCALSTVPIAITYVCGASCARQGCTCVGVCVYVNNTFSSWGEGDRRKKIVQVALNLNRSAAASTSSSLLHDCINVVDFVFYPLSVCLYWVWVPKCTRLCVFAFVYVHLISAPRRWSCVVCDVPRPCQKQQQTHTYSHFLSHTHYACIYGQWTVHIVRRWSFYPRGLMIYGNFSSSGKIMYGKK